MKHKLLVTAVAAASLSSAASAQTFWEKVTWVPTAGVQMKTLSFDQDLIGGTSGLADSSGEFEVDMPVLSVGVTAIYDKFYVALKLDNSFDDASTDSDVPFTNASPAAGGGDAFPETEVSVDREDISLTFGMNVYDRLNVFFGWMDGETVVNPDPVFDGVNQNLADVHKANGAEGYEQSYQEDGFFVGASYGWSVKELGTISTSLAYAFMDGTYEDNFFPAGQDFEYEGDSEGLSLGVTWSAPLTEHVGYYLDLRYQRYDFEGDDANGNFAGSEVETEEEMLSYSAGIQWYF